VSTEDERAALWRQQTANRIRFQRNLWLALQAPPGPRQAVLDGWMPVIQWQLERGVYVNPEEDP
jgi:hypothetical protein